MNHPAALSEDVTIIEQKMSSLERENFDLKMRLFYKEKESLKDHSTLENEAERVVGILQTRDDTYDQLRRANEEAYNTISELRAELQLVKASKEGSNSAYEGLLHKNQRLASLQLEENLKRERQATQAIAAHDASLIAKLEDDLEALQATHEADNKLVSECAGRVAELMGIVEEKNATIEKHTNALDAANEHIEVLKDRVSRQEIFLIRGDRQDLLPKAENLSIENNIESAVPPPPPRRNLLGHSLPSAQMNHTATTASMQPGSSPTRRSLLTSQQQYQQQYGQHSQVGVEEEEDEAVGSSMNLRPAPRLGQPFMSSSSAPHSHFPPAPTSTHFSTNTNTNTNTTDASSTSSSSFQHFSLSDLSSTMGTTAHAHAHSKPTLSSTLQGNSSSFPRSPVAMTSAAAGAGHRNTASPFPHTNVNSPSLPNVASRHFDTSQGYEEDTKPRGYLSEEAKKLINAEIEIDVLMEETTSLKQNLKEEKQALRRLEETLASVRSSSEEITLLEAEEIARLEIEIERISEERDKFMASSRSFEMQHELLQQRLRDRHGEGSGWQGSSPSHEGRIPVYMESYTQCTYVSVL